MLLLYFVLFYHYLKFITFINVLIFLRIESRPSSNIEFNANFWGAVLKIGFSKNKIAWGAWIV